MNLNFLGDLGKYLWPVLKSQSSTISDTGDSTKCSKGPYQIWKWKEITQKDPPDSPFPNTTLKSWAYETCGNKHCVTRMCRVCSRTVSGLENSLNAKLRRESIWNPTAAKEEKAPLGCWHQRTSEIVFGWNGICVSHQQILKTHIRYPAVTSTLLHWQCSDKYLVLFNLNAHLITHLATQLCS